MGTYRFASISRVAVLAGIASAQARFAICSGKGLKKISAASAPSTRSTQDAGTLPVLQSADPVIKCSDPREDPLNTEELANFSISCGFTCSRMSRAWTSRSYFIESAVRRLGGFERGQRRHLIAFLLKSGQAFVIQSIMQSHERKSPSSGSIKFPRV